MPPRKPQFEDEEETSSSEESSSPSSTPAIKSRNKFEDEEDDSDVVEDWEADDSEAEREKAKKEAEAKAAAAAAAAANKKSKSQRVEEHKAANAARKQAIEDESSDEEEDEGTRRARLMQQQAEAGVRQAQDLFGQADLNKSQKTAPKTLVSVDPSDPSKLADLSTLPLFTPNNKTEFEHLRNAIAPLLAANARKPHYTLFLQEFTKQIAKDLPSDQIKKLASTMTTLSNERMKEEKNADKGGKKSKAAKTKTSLVATKNLSTKADTELYDDGLDEDDFM